MDIKRKKKRKTLNIVSKETNKRRLKHGNLCICVESSEECFQVQKSEISKNNLLMWKNIAAKKKDT